MPVQRVKVEILKDNVQEVLQTDVGRFVLDTTIRVLNLAKVRCPVDTGNLRAAHQFKLVRRQSKITGEVFDKVKYALAVHNGRRQIVIRPVKKKALAFVWHGQPMVRRWVNQPARRGRPWLLDSLRDVARDQGFKMVSGAAIDQTDAAL